MTVIDRSTAQSEANTVRNEVLPAANTALRVGGLLKDLADSVAFATDIPEAGNGLQGTSTFSVKLSGATIDSSAAGIKVADNQIGNLQLRQGTACTVIGRSANSTGNVADISFPSDGTVLQRSGGVVSAAQLDLTTHFASCVRLETGSGTERGLVSYQASTDANGARVGAKKSRGTSGSPTALSAGDSVAEFWAEAHDGTVYNEVGQVQFYSVAGGSSKQTAVRIKAHDGSTERAVTETVLCAVQTTDASTTIVLSLSIPSGKTVNTAIRWRGRDTAGTPNDTMRDSIVIIRRQGSGSPSQISSQDVLTVFKDDAASGTPDWNVNTGANTLEVRVTGKAATTINWLVDVAFEVT